MAENLKKGYMTFTALGEVAPAQDGLENVALITVGEAINHDSIVDQKTLESAMACLGSKPLKSYDSHRTSCEDSVREILGFFENFSIVENKIIAKKFSFLPSADAKSKASIMECAKIAPQSIGTSFSALANLVWVLDGGEEIDFWASLKRPRKCGE